MASIQARQERRTKANTRLANIKARVAAQFGFVAPVVPLAVRQDAELFSIQQTEEITELLETVAANAGGNSTQLQALQASITQARESERAALAQKVQAEQLALSATDDAARAGNELADAWLAITATVRAVSGDEFSMPEGTSLADLLEEGVVKPLKSRAEIAEAQLSQS